MVAGCVAGVVCGEVDEVDEVDDAIERTDEMVLSVEDRNCDVDDPVGVVAVDDSDSGEYANVYVNVVGWTKP